MNCMDAFVLPSVTTPVLKEQFGKVLVEAMACEVPVIGSSSGAIPEVIGDAGLVFREGDVDDLVDKLNTLANKPVFRQELAKKGKSRVLDNFTWQKFAENTYSVFKEVLNQQQ